MFEKKYGAHLETKLRQEQKHNFARRNGRVNFYERQSLATISRQPPGNMFKTYLVINKLIIFIKVDSHAKMKLSQINHFYKNKNF